MVTIDHSYFLLVLFSDALFRINQPVKNLGYIFNHLQPFYWYFLILRIKHTCKTFFINVFLFFNYLDIRTTVRERLFLKERSSFCGEASGSDWAKEGRWKSRAGRRKGRKAGETVAIPETAGSKLRGGGAFRLWLVQLPPDVTVQQLQFSPSKGSAAQGKGGPLRGRKGKGGGLLRWGSACCVDSKNGSSEAS